MEGRERWKATGRDEAAGKLRFTHLEAFWMRLRRLRAAGASRSPGRAAGRAGPGGRTPAPTAPRPASGPASAPQERGGEKLPKLPGTSVEMGGGIGRSPSPHSRPLAEAGRAPKLGVRGGNPQRLRCTSGILSESPLRWLLWGGHVPKCPRGSPPAGFARRGETQRQPRSPSPGKGSPAAGTECPLPGDRGSVQPQP